MSENGCTARLEDLKESVCNGVNKILPVVIVTIIIVVVSVEVKSVLVEMTENSSTGRNSLDEM